MKVTTPTLRIAGGIGVAVLVYLVLRYVGLLQHAEVYEQWRVDLAQTTITPLVRTLENYKEQVGNYPNSLEALRESLPEDADVYLFDPTNLKTDGKLGLFHYELVDPEHYYLLAVGPDRRPFTGDDILPDLDADPPNQMGLMVKNGL